MTTITTEIRFAKERDAPALAEIHESAWREAYAGLVPYRSLAKMIARRSEGWWRHAIRSGAAIVVVEFGGMPIGYVTLGRNRTAALPAQAEIYEIYLRPEYQGLGFGRRLFRAARKVLKDQGLKGIAVWALSENTRAGAFYERLGGIAVANGTERFEGQVVRKTAYVFV